MKPTKCAAKEKKMRQEKWKRGEKRKQIVKVKTAVSLSIPKTAYAQTSQADILHLDQKLQSVWPVNGFVVTFSSLKHDSDQKTT